MYNESVFLSGNLEAQRLSSFKKKKEMHRFIRKHFIYTCLLSEHVFLPAANFFQSPISRTIVDEFALLFRATDRYPQLAHIGINPKKEDFRGEALEKSQTYLDLPIYDCYNDPITRERIVKKLNSITTPYMRHGELINSLSNYVKDETQEGGFLNEAIFQLGYTQEETHKILQPLILAVEKGDKAIIPEYIMFFDNQHVIKGETEKLIRLSLLKSYSVSLEMNFKAYVCNPLVQTYNEKYIFPYSVNYLDTCVFEGFMSLFPDIYNVLIRLNTRRLRELKYSERFIIFLNGYKKFVTELGKKVNSVPEITHHIQTEKTRQNEIYKSMLIKIANDAEVATLLYKSMFSIKEKILKVFGKKIIKSESICAINEDAFLYALVNEVYESFLNKYYEFFSNAVRSSNQHKIERKEVFAVFNKNIKNVGGTQNIIEKSKDVVVSTSAHEHGYLLVQDDIELIEKFASSIAGYAGDELLLSDKVHLSSALFQIAENTHDSKVCAEKINEFHGLFNALKDTAQKVVITLASSMLSQLLLTKLGLK